MGVAVLVVEQRPPLDGLLGSSQVNVNDPRGVGRRGFDGQFQGVESVAGVAAGDVGQVGQGLLVRLHLTRAVAPLLVGQGAAQERAQLLVGQGAKLEDAGAGDQGADDLEIGVFRRGADEGDSAVLDVRQQAILLGLVEAVDLVHQEDSALAVQQPPLLGLFDHPPDVGDAGQDGAKGLEVRLGAVGDDHGQRGLARAGRPPEDDGGEEAVGLDGAAQQPSRANNVLLTDHLIQGAGAQARCQRGLAGDLIGAGMVEQVF